MKVAFLGLGAIGFPMASHLTGHFDTMVWNRTFAVAEKHAAEHGSNAVALEEAAAADVIISCVPTSREVADLVDALYDRLTSGTLWIDCTSGDPATTKTTAERLAAKDIGFVDAPVTGGVPGARAGTLTVMAAGAPEHFDRARPFLDAFGGKIVHVGAVGFGHAIKAMNNAMMAANVWAATECILSLKKLGFDLPKAFEVLNAGSGGSFATASLLPLRLVDGEWPLLFKLSLLDKDVRIAAEMMHEQHMSTPVIDLVANLFTAASKTLGGDADYIEVCKYLASMNGESW